MLWPICCAESSAERRPTEADYGRGPHRRMWAPLIPGLAEDLVRGPLWAAMSVLRLV